MSELPASGSSQKPRRSSESRSDATLSARRRGELHDGGSLRLDLLHDFTLRFEQGEGPRLDSYLERLPADDLESRLELVYREFCLREARGDAPSSTEYVARFPGLEPDLGHLLTIHLECPSSFMRGMIDPAAAEPDWPRESDWIGPYHLIRELGRGAFARVFLAEHVDLENRLVVLKITTRKTQEARLLARVRHAHIVEVEDQFPVNDGVFMVLRMPFWGGATLASVLEAGGDPRRATTGRELLEQLDRAAAREYPSVFTELPAREILAGLSYEKAVAWIIARLAAALDHAFRKGVVHGDVKPSNIILTSDGNPMLLDFNLSWDSEPGSEVASRDRGGTLAYMAPERLARLRGEGAAEPIDHHRADLYSLGMVLLETLAGKQILRRESRMQRQTEGSSPDAASAGKERSQATTARELFKLAASQGRPISSGLKAILERCLDPDPLERYGYARELADDLDRFRADRPPAYAHESLLRDRIPRWMRRQKRALYAATTSVVIGMTLVVIVARSLTLQAMTAQARSKLEWYLGDLRAGAYGFQRSTTLDALEGAGDSQPRFGVPYGAGRKSSETAHQAIRDYELLSSNDWRKRDDIRMLPEADRRDLELWLLEQTYRYCRSLHDRANSPTDWERARSILDHVSSPLYLTAYEQLIHELDARLKAAGAEPSPRPPARAASDDQNEADLYLLGVAAEFDAGQFVSEIAHRKMEGDLEGQGSPPAEPEEAGSRRALERALGLYRQYLVRNPRSFWGHYRAASTSFALGGFQQAADHLAPCVARWPSNAALHLGMASCLAELGRYEEALRECETARLAVPDYPELYRSRVFILASAGVADGLEEDIQRFEILSGLLPREFLTAGASALPERPAAVVSVPLLPSSLDPLLVRSNADPLPRRAAQVEINPDEINFRGEIAVRVRRAGRGDLALGEFTKILYLDPSNLPARVYRSLCEIEASQFDEASRDLDAVFKHPGLLAYLTRDPALAGSFLHVSDAYLRANRAYESRVIARRALDLAISLKLKRGRFHYTLARAHAFAARTDPRQLKPAARQLRYAFLANRDIYKQGYERDVLFDPIRSRLDPLLGHDTKPGPRRPRAASRTLAQTE